jgi:hypothetical protein
MARPQVADGDGLQMWRVAANILNKQSRTADKGSPPAWGLGVGLTIPPRKKLICYEISKRDSDLEVEGPCEHGNEPSGFIKCW